MDSSKSMTVTAHPRLSAAGGLPQAMPARTQGFFNIVK